MAPLDKNLASGSWAKLPLAAQLANIGSEVSRVIHWQEAGDKVEKEKALERALELLDLTLADMHLPARRLELARLREALSDLFLGTREYDIPPESLEDYFLPFALRVMR